MSRDTESLPNDYLRVTEYNGYILAEKDFEYGESKKQYVTWMKNDRGVTLGHYFTDKASAKEDFAIRTELVNPNKLFNLDELAVIYKALEDFDAARNFNYKDKKLCSSIESTRAKLEGIPSIDIKKFTKIKVLIIEPDKEPKSTEITNDLYFFQDIVGGYIDMTHPNGDGSIAVVFNKEGRLHGLPANRKINGSMYVGTLVIAGYNENGDFCSLDSIQSETYKQLLSLELDIKNMSITKEKNIMQYR